MHLATIERDIFLGIVRSRGTGSEAFGNRFLGVRRVVFGERAFLSEAGVAWGTHTQINRLCLRIQ